MFKTVPTASQAVRDDAVPARALAYVRDTIALGWEERLKARARRTSDAGREFATTLPRGTVLRDGDLLIVDDLRVLVAVVERSEPVLIVRPRSAEECALFAYYIGNSHMPMMIEQSQTPPPAQPGSAPVIVCADVLGMEQVLEQYRIPFERGERPFTPVSGMADHRHRG